MVELDRGDYTTMISHNNELKRYCSEPIENIENYDKAVADTEHIWHCHHRGEILPCGRYTAAQLKKHGLYWNRPASELIFLRHDEHHRLHHIGKTHSDETRRKMSDSHMGRSRSEETKRKISKSYPIKKKVEMTRKSDGFTKRFPSTAEAARWLVTNGHPHAGGSGIARCCKGQGKSGYGCFWRYV